MLQDMETKLSCGVFKYTWKKQNSLLRKCKKKQKKNNQFNNWMFVCSCKLSLQTLRTLSDGILNSWRIPFQLDCTMSLKRWECAERILAVYRTPSWRKPGISLSALSPRRKQMRPGGGAAGSVWGGLRPGQHQRHPGRPGNVRQGNGRKPDRETLRVRVWSSSADSRRVRTWRKPSWWWPESWWRVTASTSSPRRASRAGSSSGPTLGRLTASSPPTRRRRRRHAADREGWRTLVLSWRERKSWRPWISFGWRDWTDLLTELHFFKFDLTSSAVIGPDWERFLWDCKDKEVQSGVLYSNNTARDQRWVKSH